MAATQIDSRPMYSCEGAQVLRDQDGVAFIEVFFEPTDDDWDRLLAWVDLNGFGFGAFGAILDYAEDFDDEYGDRYLLVPRHEEEVKAA